MQSILAAAVAPAAIGSGILMPIRPLWRPSTPEVVLTIPPEYQEFFSKALMFKNQFVQMQTMGGQTYLHPSLTQTEFYAEMVPNKGIQDAFLAHERVFIDGHPCLVRNLSVEGSDEGGLVMKVDAIVINNV